MFSNSLQQQSLNNSCGAGGGSGAMTAPAGRFVSPRPLTSAAIASSSLPPVSPIQQMVNSPSVAQKVGSSCQVMHDAAIHVFVAVLDMYTLYNRVTKNFIC